MEISEYQQQRKENKMENIFVTRDSFTTKELASYIDKSSDAIRNMVLRRQVPFRKLNGRLIFFKTEIDMWAEKSPGVRAETLISKFGG
jgi:hypothetical protein